MNQAEQHEGHAREEDEAHHEVLAPPPPLPLGSLINRRLFWGERLFHLGVHRLDCLGREHRVQKQSKLLLP